MVCLINAEENFSHNSSSILEKCKLFNSTTLLLNEYSESKAYSETIMRIYLRKLMPFNPFEEIVKIWITSVKITDDSIQISKLVKPAIEGLEQLGKLNFFTDKGIK
jgi:hypothetical protein